MHGRGARDSGRSRSLALAWGPTSSRLELSMAFVYAGRLDGAQPPRELRAPFVGTDALTAAADVEPR